MFGNDSHHLIQNVEYKSCEGSSKMALARLCICTGTSEP